jgi:hypothetical protein
MTAVSAHNDLYERLIVLSTRYRTTVDIGGPFREGDPAGVEEHNRANIAMIALRDAANALPVDPVVVITLPDEAFPGDSGHVADHALMETALSVLEAVVLPWEV